MGGGEGGSSSNCISTTCQQHRAEFSLDEGLKSGGVSGTMSFFEPDSSSY